jgi:hypothetical protein
MFIHSCLGRVLPVPPHVGALNVAYVLEKETFLCPNFPNAVRGSDRGEKDCMQAVMV